MDLELKPATKDRSTELFLKGIGPSGTRLEARQSRQRAVSAAFALMAIWSVRPGGPSRKLRPAWGTG